MGDLSADEAAILEVILRVRRAAHDADFETIASSYVHAPYAARWNASRGLGGIFVRQGWEAMAEKMRAGLADTTDQRPAGGPEDDATIENLNIRISGDLAWVTFTRSYPTKPAHRASPGPGHHLRILERHDGQWRMAIVAFLDPGTGRPDSSLIRIDASGKVIWMNDAAAAALGAEPDIEVRGGRLRIRDTKANTKLTAAIRWAAALDHGMLPEQGALPIVLEAGEGLPAKIWWVIGDSGAILFSFGEPGRASRHLDAAAAVYGLSPAQRRIAGYIVEGMSLGEIAKAMQVKPSTVRTQLDRMFEKTGARSQPALVRALLSAAAPL